MVPLICADCYGFPRGDRKPAGIGCFRAKTNGTEGSNPPLSATQSVVFPYNLE